jgi:hypothetical protein
MPAKQLTVANILQDLLRDVTEPMPLSELVDRVLQRYESKAKNPRSSVRAKIAEESGHSLVFTDRAHVLPIGIAMRGVRFRIPLSQFEIDEGGFVMGYLSYYVPSGRSPLENRIKLLDAQGRPIQTRKNVYVKTDDDAPDEYTDIRELLDVKDWLRAKGARVGDYLIVTVEDWGTSTLRLEFEKASEANMDEIARRDQQLCDILFDMLEHTTHEALYLHEAIPSALARQPDKGGYAGHHWLIALQMDERVVYDGFTIRYSDAPPSLFERIWGGYEFEGKPFTREQGAQVYRFSARLKYGKREPVIVEIQGHHTLYDLDQILREAFGHDTWDHLGGFWLLVPRAGKRVREVEIGACAPDPNFDLDSSAMDVAVAGLGLSPGNRMKYVYDFGDWVEHELVLEAIEPPQSRVRYPRIVSR